MNKYVRMAVCVPFGLLKLGWTKLFHWSGLHASPLCAMSPFSEITMDAGSALTLYPKVRVRGGGRLRVRRGGHLTIGRNVSVNHGDMIVCHKAITIGDDVQLSPNVMIYDHDHDFRAPGGAKSMGYRASPVVIGNNVWIGAGAVILRGTRIGDNCVVAAGSVVKGEFPPDTLIYQRRETVIRAIEERPLLPEQSGRAGETG